MKSIKKIIILVIALQCLASVKCLSLNSRNEDSNESCDHDEKCVPYYLCKESGLINSDAGFLITERLDGLKEPAITCSSLEICCKFNLINNVTTSQGSSATSSQAETCDRDNDFSDYDFLFGPPDKPKSCGFRNENGLSGLTENDQNETVHASYAEFPWMVAIAVEKNDSAPVFKSGGSLIHPKVVLTSAHNIEKITDNNLIVRAGEWDFMSDREIFKSDERKVQNVIAHELFTRDNLQNDVALLILNEPFKMTSAINTVCLPPPNINFDGQRCWASGWGKNELKSKTFNTILKKVDLPIVSSEECQQMLRLTIFGEDFILHEKMLCAGGEKGKDLCIGDGGSPLVCPIASNPELFYQVGIAIGGNGCGKESTPGLYADVSKYKDWIDGKMTSLGLNSCFYTFEKMKT